MCNMSDVVVLPTADSLFGMFFVKFLQIWSSLILSSVSYSCFSKTGDIAVSFVVRLAF